jgi:hypothetical protein
MQESQDCASHPDKGIEEAELFRGKAEFLKLLQEQYQLIREWSVDRVLPTDGVILWQDFVKAVHSEQNLREAATDICQWLERQYSIAREDTLHFFENEKILICDGIVYDTSKCFIQSRVLRFYYDHRERVVPPDEIHIRVLGSKGSSGRVKDYVEALPVELRARLRPVEGSGRIWCD